ncbi:MAG: 50S ribosomal protein L24 [Candidatus Pacebacteria bacterium]|nr:50S ribosomal protein L24 [Candidatus Paceibacterota bacterium]
MKSKLKKNDQIQVLLGKDRGKKGKIEKVYRRRGLVLVQGMNLVVKHVKSQGEGKPGGRVKISKPLPISKVALICPRCNRPTRVGWQSSGTKKVRICRKCQQII